MDKQMRQDERISELREALQDLVDAASSFQMNALQHLGEGDFDEDHNLEYFNNILQGMAIPRARRALRNIERRL